MPNRLKLQIRVEAINALNYTVLWNPNVDPRNATFGFINQDRNNPRDIQNGAVHVLALRGADLAAARGGRSCRWRRAGAQRAAASRLSLSSGD